MAFNKDELKEIAKLLKEQGQMQDRLNESMASYVEHLKKIQELTKNIKHVSEQVNKLKAEENNLSEDLKKLVKDRNKGSKEEIEARRKEIKLIIDKIKAKRVSVELTEKQLKVLKETNDAYIEQARNVNKINLGLKEGSKFLKQVPSLLNKGYGKFKSFGLFDVEKAAKNAALEIGIVSKNTNGFRQNMYDTAKSTFDIGVHTKDLAKMQALYSSELGTSTQLSQEGFEAISEIAKGTMLGVEGASMLVAEMNKFNVSAADSNEVVGEIVTMSQKMGVNSNKVLKSLQNNLKMANKYHFKDGVKGMARMAAMAEKFHISMDATAGMADQLFDIEGAVEMAAKLNTMGGEWAKLGDAQQLMFKARNDMEGLQEDVIKATAGMADFNAETGEFSFSGLELHRMRELEKITGISAENMAEMSKQQAKFSKIRGQMAGTGISEEMMKFVEAQAEYNKTSGKYEIKLEGSKKVIPVDELNKLQENELENAQKSLRDRAEAAQTFDDLLTSTIEQGKELFLPILEGINGAMPDMRDMVKGLMTGGLAEKIQDAARTIGNIVGGAIKFLSDFPQVIAIALAAGPLLSATKWLFNGVQLGLGFLKTVGPSFGGGGVGGSGGGWGGGSGGKGGKGWGRFGNTKVGKGMGKLGKGIGGFGGGLAGVAIGMGLDYGRDQMDDPNSALGKGLGVASGAVSGAGTGAMIGSFLGPIGTGVGAVIGALVGGISSAIDEYSDEIGFDVKSHVANTKMNDAILANGKIQPIDSKDKVFEISKPGGAYDKAANAGPGNFGAGNGGGTTKIHITFDTLMVKSDDSVGQIDLNRDSVFIAQLATKVKEALSQTANGGVLSPNPA